MRFAGFVLIALAISDRVTAQGDGAKELKQLDGTWEVTALEVDGKVQPKEKSPKQIVITGDKLTGLGPEMTITVDPAKKPKWIDLIFKKDNKQYPIRSIYEISGDELRICMPLAPRGKGFDNKRPESFDTKGKAVALFKAKRATKKNK
jgi:uncharacterized protein (TIGR03067 family)